MKAKPNVIIALQQLLKLGASEGSISLNTHQLAKILEISQQGASRRLLELEKQGYIERRVSRRGQLVKLTQPALELLRQDYQDLKRVFEAPSRERFVFEGVAFTGLGEGRYYMSIEGYRKQFIEKLGFEPFPGTLNLRLTSAQEMEARRQLESKSLVIPGFQNGQRTYGGVRVMRARVNRTVDGAVLLIERTHYGRDVLEVVAPMDLRRRFKIRDGDRVRVEVSA